MNELYVWCMMNWEHLPDSRYTGTLQTVWGKHVCTVNVCDWLTAPCDQDEAELTQEWWWFGGWSGAVAMLLWTEWVFGARSTCVSALWQCEVGAGRRTCLSGTQTGGAGSLSPTVCGPGLKPVLGQIYCPSGVCPVGPDAPGHCMTGAFLVFFGAATKCAMCYVAWFIIFLQATKLICSPIV